MKERAPAEVFPPGEYIEDELAERGWTHGLLAEKLGLPVDALRELLSGRRELGAETADGLALAFGTSAQVWLNLEARYRMTQGAVPSSSKGESSVGVRERIG